MCRLSCNLGASTSWNPQCMSRPVMGLLYLLLDKIVMTEHKLALVKLSNCYCSSVKSSKDCTDTESDLCPLTRIEFSPSFNTENDFQVYEQLLVVASRFLASDSQMLWSTTKSRKSCWPCNSCSTSTCLGLIISHRVRRIVLGVLEPSDCSWVAVMSLRARALEFYWRDCEFESRTGCRLLWLMYFLVSFSRLRSM
jgi:hypothetical protein